MARYIPGNYFNPDHYSGSDSSTSKQGVGGDFSDHADHITAFGVDYL